MPRQLNLSSFIANLFQNSNKDARSCSVVNLSLVLPHFTPHFDSSRVPQPAEGKWACRVVSAVPLWLNPAAEHALWTLQGCSIGTIGAPSLLGAKVRVVQLGSPW